MKLYSYYQSSASYRVRIALNLKGIAVESAFIDLTKGDQHQAAYAAVNPQQLVPSLILDNGQVLTQSIAIMEYLEEIHPEVPILPKDPVARAQARAIAAAVAGDISAINNLKIRKRLTSQFKATDEDIKDWVRHWITDGFTAIEALLARSAFTGTYCVGETPTVADCCLAPQMFNAKRFHCELAAFPTINRIVEACDAHPAFLAAHPSQQPDAPAA